MNAHFSADWLALREPFDDAARSAAAAPAAAADREMTIVDLACGTGANLRHLAPRIGGRQTWRLIDHDADLLARVPACIAQWAAEHGWCCEHETVAIAALGRAANSAATTTTTVTGDGFTVTAVTERLDLSADPAVARLAGADLVTTSALLDLVSARWLERLVALCAHHRAAVGWALSYDGRIEWTPADPFDDAITDAVNRHQRRDKGFGPALGPAAAGTARRLLEAAGMSVQEWRSDWVIGDADDGGAMQAALIAGWATAALEIESGWRDAITDWARRRHKLAAEGGTGLRVGHRDLFGDARQTGSDAGARTPASHRT